MLLRLIPIGDVDTNLLNALITDVSGVYNLRARVLPKTDIPQSAYNIWRKQYDAEKLIESISQNEGKFIDRTIPGIGITEVDIYYNGLNFVYSYEDIDENVGIVSIYRLREEFYDKPPNFGKLVDRTIKEILHVLGHLLGLEHCTNKTCLMYPSESIVDLDRKNFEFCDNCLIKLNTKGINIEKY